LEEEEIGKAEDFLGRVEEKISRAEDFLGLFFLPPGKAEDFFGLAKVSFSGRWKCACGRRFGGNWRA